jgi:hypothetical protein
LSTSGNPGASTQASFSINIPTNLPPTDTNLHVVYDVQYQGPAPNFTQYQQVPQFNISIAPPQAVPEPNTLILAGLGGGCWIVYAMARKRRQTRDRYARY